jgi:hypothetical protein
MLCSNSRIFLEAIQTIESGTPSVRESCSCTWEHMQVEGATKDVGSSREFQEFIEKAGCTQPHRQVRRKVDNFVVPLILLPMNITKVDVFHFVNEEVKKMVCGEPLSIASFHKMWRIEFPHIQIPPFSRFSKCYYFGNISMGWKQLQMRPREWRSRTSMLCTSDIKWRGGMTNGCSRGQL